MSIFRIASVSTLALLATLQTADTASADHRHRMRILWPKIFAPEITGYVYRDEYDEDDDDAFFDPEDEDEYIARNRRDRRVVLDLYDDDLEPEYLPPKKAVPKTPVKKIAAKKPVVKSTQTTDAVAKPKLSPILKPGIKSAALKEPKAVATAKASTPKAALVASAAPVVAKPVIPKPAAPKTQLASSAPAAGTIGCSKGAEIVSGYGFTSVKPKSCTGGSYSFDASRGASGYLIKLSAATGEITDVTKLK